MGTLANILTILLLVIDISRDTFGMGLLLVIPLMVCSATLTMDKRFYSVGACSVTASLVYKESMLIQIEGLTNAQLTGINQMTTIIALSCYLILFMTVCVLLITKQCKIEGPNEILERKFQIVDSASLTTLYLWALIMIIYLGCNGFFKIKVLCATSIATIGLLCLAFVSLKAMLRKAVNDEKAKRLEQGINRTEVPSGNTN